MESLTEIIVALIKNSLDANSSSIAIRVCLELFWIQILDNGNGISEEDLQSIGKCCLMNIDHDRKKPSKQFARLTGESLLYLIGKCEEVLIESVDECNGKNNKSHSRLFKQQTNIAANDGSQRNFQPVSQYHYVRKSRGTTVTLKNIFFQDSDRKRNHSIKEDYSNLLVILRSLALIHYDRSFTLQDLGTSEVVFKSKRLTAFLPKYCELFHLTERDIDVTTCRKDDVLIECYFSERQIRRALSPIHFTFINGLPSSELSPTVDKILTQQKHDIDFVITVTFPKNDVLTQLNQPIIKNCLLRCLNQYKVCLKQRSKEQQHSISPSVLVKIARTPTSLQAMKDFAEKRKQNRDEEDILYGLSQPLDDRQTTFDKCTKWLKTNDFGVLAGASPGPKIENPMSVKPYVENGTRQKINFFEGHTSSGAPRNKKDGDKQKSSAPKNKISLQLPIPKFYSKDAKAHEHSLKTTNVRKDRDEQKKQELNNVELPSERVSFLNIAAEINYSEITMPDDTTLFEPTKKLQNFTKREKKKLLHSSQHAFSPLPGETILGNKQLTVFCEFGESNNLNDATIDSPEPIEARICVQLPAETVEPKIEHSSFQCYDHVSPRSTSNSGIYHAFAEPLFLEPAPEDDTYNISSPKARFYDLDLVESYIDFRNACQETIKNFKIAIEPIDSSDSSDCECCSTNQFDREIEKLRQPFHRPRNIFAKVGNRRDDAS
ncbi:uncharacterized protein LOC135708844 [Ochlerotatus camptorhynchus]|uniref:uncharacterized protein LOC135708844 n=1 Tax=Ochlerotatus camptorhynchus TaxID=644619 RepID=UPI0031D8EADA